MHEQRLCNRVFPRGGFSVRLIVGGYGCLDNSFTEPARLPGKRMSIQSPDRYPDNDTE